MYRSNLGSGPNRAQGKPSNVRLLAWMKQPEADPEITVTSRSIPLIRAHRFDSSHS
jgi:hypothetical protein